MKPENGDTWQFAAVPFEAGNHLSQTSKQKHMPSWLVTEKCITNPILGRKKLPSTPSAVCQWETNGWGDHGRALTAVSGLRCSSSTFAKIATKFAFSSQRQHPAAALGVRRPLIGLASENVADDIFHPLTWDNHAKSTSKCESLKMFKNIRMRTDCDPRHNNDRIGG